ncbi:hypothetical protein A3768_1563 [Ralstonia solanacearum]|nr:hypothetical protein F504_1955 [Ralstonia pseudosolanacearum FQY_4]ANH32719.1 hypothetical protein A3768_1563 [Ralstonia solanacearum]
MGGLGAKTCHAVPYRSIGDWEEGGYFTFGYRVVPRFKA